jgi:photosystem II stability/assembly factor-like uncharacterized protein
LSIAFAQTGWVEQTNPLGFGEEAMVGKVHFVSSVEGWISANGGRFLHTTDGGNNWEIIDPFPTDTVWNFSDPAVDMCWVNENYGWRLNILGTDFNDARGALLYKTTNGGINWTKKYVSTKTSVVAAQIDFVDQNYGWITLYDLSLGERILLKSTDGGNTWNEVNVYSPDGAWVDFIDHNNGWLLTTSPHPPYEIQRTTDGGTNWATQYTFNGTSQDSSGFDCVFFTDVNSGWVVGDNGKILHTTNGGASWNFVSNSNVNTNEECKTVFFLDANTGWVSSKFSDNEQTPYLAFTSDGGSTWTSLETPFGDPQGYNAIFSIHFINPQNGWVTADYGRIAKYTGATSVDDEINSMLDYSLGQNYPNPFNPTTTIKYNIPESGFTTIRVYNLLGSEVATLVNEVKPQGTYEVSFSSAELPSGVYFYSMEVNSFREIRKMILLK